MKKIIHLCCVAFGLLCVGIGVVGVVFPILPATPFFILAAICFAKGSKRFQRWFSKTALYRNYVIPVLEQKAMEKQAKINTLAILGIIFLICIFLVPIWWAKIIILIVAVFHFYYFIWKIKTILPTETNY